jgi:hypothetical protein
MKRCNDAHRALCDTAKLRTLATDARDPLEDTQRMDVRDKRDRRSEAMALQSSARERRKPETVGERQYAVETARDIFIERQQQLIEAGIWPTY